MKYRCSFLLLVMLPVIGLCQRISYSEPETEDARTLDFEIIGKVGGNFLVYKNIRNRYAVSVYDNDMALKERVQLDIPDKTLNADFIAYPDFVYIIYQYQKKSVLHCMALKIDGNAKKMAEPIELDTTQISIFADNKIYNMVKSEDKQKIMVYKIQKKYDRFNFKTILFNAQLEQLHASRFQMPYDERKEAFSDFYLDNQGTFVATKSIRGGSRELVSKLFLLTKPPVDDQFQEFELPLNKSYLDEVTVKVDNVNKRYLLNSFYYNQKRGNIDGLYTAIWDKAFGRIAVQSTVEFNEEIKKEAKSEGSVRFAFNDFFIRNVILKKDGGFILSAEDFTSQSRGGQWNRMDYLYGYPYISSYDYYINSRSAYWDYYRPRNANSLTRYFYNNIVALNIDKEGKMVWSNIIRKEQFDDGEDNLLSYQLVNVGGELHYLFNEPERRNQLIADQTLSADGKITRNPTLKSLDKGYQFMPKFAKQVSAKQIIVPCLYRTYICFAKIDYE